MDSTARWVDLCMATQYATRDPSGIAGFMIGRGRLPKIDERDGRKPWKFRGWLLPYVIGADLYPGPIMPGRWGYWLRLIEGGAGPDTGPPPRVIFQEPSTGAAAYKNLVHCCELLADETGFSSAPSRLIEWLAWALACVDEPAHRLSEKAEEALYREFNAGLWLVEPADYLGLLLSEFKGRAKDPTGFFPTPQSVVSMMTRMSMGSDEFDPSRTFCDPCIGTGRFPLEASNYCLYLSGQDISYSCVLATKINGALYAPWLAFPLPRPSGETTARIVPTAIVEAETTGQRSLFDGVLVERRVEETVFDETWTDS